MSTPNTQVVHVLPFEAPGLEKGDPLLKVASRETRPTPRAAPQ